MDKLLNSGQKKLLSRLAVYPASALKSIIGLLISVVIVAAVEVVVRVKFDSQIKSMYVFIMLLMYLVLMGVFAYTFVYYKTRLTSMAYRDIRTMAGEYSVGTDWEGKVLNDSSDNWNGSISIGAEVERLCDFYRVSYNKSTSNLLIVIPVLVTFVLSGLGFYNCVTENREAVSRITETQQAIIEAYPDMAVDFINDPAKDSMYYTYSVYLVKKGEGDKVEIDFSVLKSGKITNIDYSYDFNDELSVDENLERAEQLFSELEPPLASLADRMESPERASFRYKMTEEFKRKVRQSAASGSSESIYLDSADGHFYVYESMHKYSTTSIGVSMYYSEYAG